MRRVLMGTLLVLAALVLLAGGLWAGTRYHRQLDAWTHGVAGEGGPATAASAAGPKQFYTCSMHPAVLQEQPGKCPICHMDLEPVRGDVASAGPKKERKVLYWTDPMYNPPYISDKPGKSPMGMDLLPVYDDEVSGGPAITIDPTIVQNMGLRVAKVSAGPLRTTLRVVGTLVEPEQNHVEVNLRVSGWIQKLYANQDGMPVAKGDKLFDLYSADLTAAADELINATKSADAVAGHGDELLQRSSAAVAGAARRKLELLGLAAADIDAISKLDKAPATVTFTSPITGHVVDKAVVEGSAVKAGDRVLRIADRSTMWLQVQVYEHQLPLVPVGTPVRARISGVPGKVFEGKIEFIYPHLDMMARTATMRVVIPNEGHALHEGMYANVEIDAQIAEKALQVPREAVIDSGTRQIVFVALAGGHFEPRKVAVGQSGRDADGGDDDRVQILSGLAGNETVVTSGQFLLDSESRMKEAIQKHLRDRLATGGTMPAPATAPAAMPASMPAPEATAGPADALFRAYLDLQKALVGDAKAVDPSGLSAAAAAAASALPPGEARTLANEIAGESAELAALPVDKQRETFKALSTAVIKLADQAPPSTAVAPALAQFHCPMAQADWLQAGEEAANPYMADMRTCGTLTRKLAPRPMEKRP